MLKKAICELFGTFFIIFLSLSAIELNVLNSTIGTLGIALVFGFSTLIMFAIFLRISKSHFNPAISFTMFIMGEINIKELAVYIVSQFIGGMLAGLLLTMLFGKSMSYTLVTINQYLISQSDIPSYFFIIIVEFIGSFIVMFTYKYSINNKKVGALYIGGIIFILVLIFYNITGSGLNIIRIIVPSIYNLKFDNVIFYIIGILFGTLTGGLCYHQIMEKKSKKGD
ncbi:MAG: hypothetical protein A2086_07415 [Spirochaetes bacterium GWD1_27_9]|nr:MAG: hypothetical protein A2Z98_13280 [Spirochaetes bacterium GWB1_27_13]OHD26278.1 MAG: hypothetical protein A2Y34_13185 [Spirochaetes bacterium GWC1_27_15]OHD32122.1 MAG: hypothetical protein A2086_07415 [Spirochaetes bacterium GWD1_27_9]